MYFLGIVLKQDLNDGYLNPEYILCRSERQSAARTGFRVYRFGSPGYSTAARVLVQRPVDHPELVEFLSNYRTRDHVYKKGVANALTEKYRPEGALFWFECNEYGEMTGKKVYIKKIPDSRFERDNCAKAIKKAQEKEISMTERFTDQPGLFLSEGKVQNLWNPTNLHWYHNGKEAK